MAREDLIVASDKDLAMDASKIPLLSVQGYANKGADSKKRAAEISKILITYQNQITPPQSLFTLSLKKYLPAKFLRISRMHLRSKKCDRLSPQSDSKKNASR